MHRIRTAAVLATTCGTLIVATAGSASARTITLHFFQKQVYSNFTGPNGQAVPPNAPPAFGDRLPSQMTTI